LLRCQEDLSCARGQQLCVSVFDGCLVRNAFVCPPLPTPSSKSSTSPCVPFGWHPFRQSPRFRGAVRMHGSPVGDARRHVLFATLARGRCVHVTREGVLRAITSRERQTRHGHNGAIAKALATLATHPVIHCRRRLPTTIDDALCSCISFFFPAHTGRLSRKLVITQQLAQVLASVWSVERGPPAAAVAAIVRQGRHTQSNNNPSTITQQRQQQQQQLVFV
jgi:hypothetical protein